jgi:hypothetical protein
MKMTESPKVRLMILDTPKVKRPQARKLHAPDCRWAFSGLKRRDRGYREATAEEIRTHARCSHC